MAMCIKCLAEKGNLLKENWSHQCKCNKCYNPARPSYYIQDLLNQLEFDETKNGYVLVKEVTIPKCPICHEEYAMVDHFRVSEIIKYDPMGDSSDRLKQFVPDIPTSCLFVPGLFQTEKFKAMQGKGKLRDYQKLK
ncbi:unnamed protein product, partial [Mesorhabditis belari]|uniref:Uncharacterized protein n=1 Tax=Mesorhabditis belari TaxID=2138241 RepID=A0AAF3EM58_9BILA